MGWVADRGATFHSEPVPPIPSIPPALKLGPFSVEEARAAGLSETSLRGKSWQRLSHGLYCWTGLALDPWRLLNAWQRLFPEFVFAGCTAAWLHGIDLDPLRPVEVIVPSRSGMRSRFGLKVRRVDLDPSDAVQVRHLKATSPIRTLSDLSSRLNTVDALALIDASIRLGLIDRIALSRSPSACVRALAPLAEPAESPMETRLRWLLFEAGLPRPDVQTDLRDSNGRLLGRADLYYPPARLVIEYDGANHRDRLLSDNRRQNLLVDSGYTVLRFASEDIYRRPDAVVAQVRRALSAAAAACARRPAAARR